MKQAQQNRGRKRKKEQLCALKKETQDHLIYLRWRNLNIYVKLITILNTGRVDSSLTAQIRRQQVRLYRP